MSQIIFIFGCQRTYQLLLILIVKTRSLTSFFFFDSSFESSWLEGLIEFVMAGTYGCDFLPLLADHGIGIILLFQASSPCDDVAYTLNGLFFLS